MMRTYEGAGVSGVVALGYISSGSRVHFALFARIKPVGSVLSKL
jgi:hypothetical protein